MCGILGSFPATPHHIFKQALDRIAHRGPDGYDIWSHTQQVTLGHRRLSILDIGEGGKQPMHYKHLTITFNGEIYNFLELKKNLIQKGHRFKSESDTEVILAAYLEWGTNCFEQFNGMWALAIYNQLDNTLLLSRDRFGKKPLYYAFYKDKFYFSSEMKGISAFFKNIALSKDFKWCYQHGKTYEATDKCLIKHLKRFPAGAFGFLDFKAKTIKIKKYWDTLSTLVDVPKTYEAQVEALKTLFIDACKIRMRADVPIGTSLSGGLDSSTVVGTLAHIGKTMTGERLSSDWQFTVVAAFPNTVMDETYYAKKVTDHVGITPTIININEITQPEKLEKYIGLIEEITLTNPIPMVETYGKMRSSGVVVTLDGHGADELLSGYHYGMYEALYDCGFFNFKGIRDIAQTRLNTIPDGKEFKDRHKGWLDVPFFLIRNLGIETIYRLKDMPLFSKFFNRPLPLRRPKKIKELGYFNTMLYNLFHEVSMPVHLRNYDRYSMINGVEIRMPFMDHRIVSFLFSIPWDSKIRNGYTKSILRDVASAFIPHEVAYRKKKIGFGAPMAQLMQKDWKTYLLDMVHSKDFESSQVINSTVSKNKVLQVINAPQPSFAAAQNAYQSISPYIWEKTVLKKHRPVQF